MRVWGIVGLALAAASSFGADDFWNHKSPEKWSDAEIKRIVTESPWAKLSIVHSRATAPPSFEPPMAPAGTNGVAELPTPVPKEILVRWDSATPVLEACSKGGMERHLFSCVSKLLYLSGLGKKFDDLRKEFFIVGLSNYPKLIRDEDTPQHSDAANAALERLSKRIQEATILKRRGKTALKPAYVVTLPAGQTLLVVVFFPRTDPLSAADKEVSFELAEGPVELKATFDLRKMLYRGNLEL